MKILSSILALLMLTLIGYTDDRLIPFDNFYVNVTTSENFMNQRGEGSLRVSLTISRSKEKPEGDVSYSVNCFKFSAGKRMFLKDEIATFYEASDAAENEKVFLKETKTVTYYGVEKTVFKTVKKDEVWVIQVSRAGKDVTFDIAEAARLKKALKEVEVGKVWFNKLLGNEKLPKPVPGARPPISPTYYLTTELGKVNGRGMAYEVSVDNHTFRAPVHYKIGHTIIFNNGKATASGGWVKELLTNITKALQAAKEGKEFTMTHKELNFKTKIKEKRYTVTANLKTKEADVIYYPSKFFNDKNPKFGFFGQDKLNEINKLIKACEARKQWFKEHETWFFTTK